MLCFKEKSHVPLLFFCIQNYYFFCLDFTFTLFATDTAFTTEKIHLNTCRVSVWLCVCVCYTSKGNSMS